MKSVVTEKDQEKPFPKLMKSVHTGNIIFFERSGKGQVVNTLGRAGGQIGEINIDWGAENFIDFPGTVTLSND